MKSLKKCIVVKHQYKCQYVFNLGISGQNTQFIVSCLLFPRISSTKISNQFNQANFIFNHIILTTMSMRAGVNVAIPSSRKHINFTTDWNIYHIKSLPLLAISHFHYDQFLRQLNLNICRRYWSCGNQKSFFFCFFFFPV